MGTSLSPVFLKLLILDEKPFLRNHVLWQFLSIALGAWLAPLAISWLARGSLKLYHGHLSLNRNNTQTAVTNMTKQRMLNEVTVGYNAIRFECLRERLEPVKN